MIAERTYESRAESVVDHRPGAVEVELWDDGPTPSDMVVANLTPSEARSLAGDLLKAADLADGVVR